MSKIVAKKLIGVIDKAGIKRVYAVTEYSLNHVNGAVRRQENKIVYD